MEDQSDSSDSYPEPNLTNSFEEAEAYIGFPVTVPSLPKNIPLDIFDQFMCLHRHSYKNILEKKTDTGFKVENLLSDMNEKGVTIQQLYYAFTRHTSRTILSLVLQNKENANANENEDENGEIHETVQGTSKAPKVRSKRRRVISLDSADSPDMGDFFSAKPSRDGFCRICREEEAFIKKRGLCSRCYGREYRAFHNSKEEKAGQLRGGSMTKDSRGSDTTSFRAASLSIISRSPSRQPEKTSSSSTGSGPGQRQRKRQGSMWFLDRTDENNDKTLDPVQGPSREPAEMSTVTTPNQTDHLNSPTRPLTSKELDIHNLFEGFDPILNSYGALSSDDDSMSITSSGFEKFLADALSASPSPTGRLYLENRPNPTNGGGPNPTNEDGPNSTNEDKHPEREEI